MKKIILPVLAAFLICSFQALPQDKTLDQSKKEYDEFLKTRNEDFEKYVKEQDKQFAEYLRQYWAELKLMQALKPDTTPKPLVAPKYVFGAGEAPVNKMIPAAPYDIIPSQQKELPRLTPIAKPDPLISPLKETSFIFYGTPLYLKYDPGIAVEIPAEINGNTIAGYWERISKTDYEVILSALGDEYQNLQLNDWGYYQLTRKMASSLYSDSRNGANLLTWFLLTKSGYRIKVAYDNNQVYLMVPTRNTLFFVNYFTFDTVKYYLLDALVPSVLTYEKDFPGADRLFDLNFYRPMNLGRLNATLPVNFAWKDSTYDLTLRYNMNSVEFYKEYPLSDISVYFNSFASDPFRKSLTESLGKFIAGRSEAEAAGLLLSMVQLGFEYKTDEEQYNGREKWNFPEENLYYPFNDCDDRSVLYAYLVKNLLGLEVIGLNYPGHIATAVNFSGDVPGDYIMHQGKKFVVADPTYINAPVGSSMEKYRNTRAGIIEIAPALRASR